LIRHRLGLDQHWYWQFWHFLKNFVTGDKGGWPGLGYTYAGGGQTSVLSLVLQRAPRTLLLIAGAAVLWLTSGVAVGVLSAVKRRSIADRLAMGFALFGISTPVFWLGLMFLFIFWRQLGWTGGSGYVSPSESVTGFFSHMILPWTALALLYAAFYARMTRNNLLETLGEDYIRTARAKGLSERRVIFKHGLRASLTPIVTMFGLDIALLVGGAVITESVSGISRSTARFNRTYRSCSVSCSSAPSLSRSRTSSWTSSTRSSTRECATHECKRRTAARHSRPDRQVPDVRWRRPGGQRGLVHALTR
jgi:peptide/nickel transport system permease protein